MYNIKAIHLRKFHHLEQRAIDKFRSSNEGTSRISMADSNNISDQPRYVIQNQNSFPRKKLSYADVTETYTLNTLSIIENSFEDLKIVLERKAAQRKTYEHFNYLNF